MGCWIGIGEIKLMSDGGCHLDGPNTGIGQTI